MYSIDISIDMLISENAYCFYLSKEKVVKVILYGLHLKTGKIKGFTLNGGAINAKIGYEDSTYNMTVGGKEYSITDETLNLIVSFLLDCTNEIIWYNHIDFNLWHDEEMTDFTVLLSEPIDAIPR